LSCQIKESTERIHAQCSTYPVAIHLDINNSAYPNSITSIEVAFLSIQNVQIMLSTRIAKSAKKKPA
ncbi:hypothetical protein, partial [Shewanella psychromarinicola]|uniref:hypothetical protein n=1 Tax=Shewanella psychromarinicola TaxID=2487742 RepID=UPI00200C3354